MAISSPGIGSNLDVNSIVSQLMAIERRPVELLATKEARFQTKLSAVGSIKGALSHLQSSLGALTSASTFAGSRKATVGDASVLTASASNAAATGNYQLSVTQLAVAHKLKSGAFSTQATAVGSGSITIQFGSVSGGLFTANGNRGATTIAIAAGKNTLADIRNAINDAKAGVTASIINDGTGYRLSVVSNFSGTENTLKLSVSDSDANHTDALGLSQLVFDPAAAGVKNLTETQATKDARFSIDGIDVVKASNTVTDVVDGLTINLLKEGASTSLTVGIDKSSIRTTIESFVKAYNDANKTLRDLGSYNAETKAAGVLQGDPTLRTIQSQMKSIVTGQLSFAGGGLRSLSDIGIGFQRDGSLALNSTKLNSVLDDPSKDISTLFAAVGTASDSLISVSSAVAPAQPGRYAVKVTQLATQGFSTNGIASTTVTAGVNDRFGATVNGTSISVTLNAGTYTAGGLAAEIQSKINGSASASSAGIKVAVSANAGTLRVESAAYGSTSSVVGLTSALLAGTPASTAGVDVAGSIGSLTGTGSGQELSGDGNAKGLKIKVTGGAVGVGVDRGTITFETGFAAQLDKLLGTVLEAKGTLSGKTDGINASIKAINDQADVLARRMVQIEARYRRQFTSLDTLLSGFSQTSAFLQQQLATLTPPKN